jgi:hypothetical protein
MWKRLIAICTSLEHYVSYRYLAPHCSRLALAQAENSHCSSLSTRTRKTDFPSIQFLNTTGMHFSIYALKLEDNARKIEVNRGRGAREVRQTGGPSRSKLDNLGKFEIGDFGRCVDGELLAEITTTASRSWNRAGSTRAYTPSPLSAGAQAEHIFEQGQERGKNHPAPRGGGVGGAAVSLGCEAPTVAVAASFYFAASCGASTGCPR